MRSERANKTPETPDAVVAELDALLQDTSKREELLAHYHPSEGVEAIHEDLLKESVADTFVREWRAYLLECAGDAAAPQAAKYRAQKAYQLVGVIESLAMDWPEFRDANIGIGTGSDGKPKEVVIVRHDSRDLAVLPVQPHYGFKEHLGFDRDDLFCLPRRLKPVPHNIEVFYTFERVTDCLDYLASSCKRLG
ncbi:hypothetical protein KY361_01895 [Candidatus Woesearchaeota archaeon]|nr:hypothetical protein [Candidatus Woesearchaeota archaeon]